MIKMAAKKRTQDVLISEDWSFSSLLLSKHTLDGLKVVGFKKPSPVQVKSIPLGKCGLDLIVQAKSGTGKTCVFAVVALEMISTTSLDPQVIVLAPTREIAVQIYEFFCAIGSYTENLHCNVFIGGTAVDEDKKKLSNCQIVIGTPGRVKSLIDTGVLQTDAIRLFVLDEADKLLEPGSFQEQINWIYSTLPRNKQVLALSATYPEYLAKHLINYMNEPAHIRLDTEKPTLLGIRQLYMAVEPHHLPHAIFEKKAKILAGFLRRYPFQQCMVFSNYQARAQILADMLTDLGWPASCIAGSQSQTDRFKAMKQLKDFKCRVLISTDLTSRGIDCDKVDLVINLDMPWDCETYLHRVGRAGRFGNYGVALSLVAKGKEEEKLLHISREIKYKIEKISDTENAGDIANDLTNFWQSHEDPSDLQDAQLNGTEDKLSYSQQDNLSDSPNVEGNLLDSVESDTHVLSVNSTEKSLNANKALSGLPALSNETTVKDDLKSVPEDSNDLSGCLQDSLKPFHSLNGESFSHSNSLLPCNYDLSSNHETIRINGSDITPYDVDSQGSEKRENNRENVAAEICCSHFDLVKNCRDPCTGSGENFDSSKHHINESTKDNVELVEEEVSKVLDNGKMNCRFIMSNSKSLERTSYAESNSQENVTCDANECQNISSYCHESLEEKATDLNEEEMEEKCQCFSKDPKETEVIDLENMIGDLVCENLIESGARMLREYYLSKGVLGVNLAESENKNLHPGETNIEIEDKCEPGMLSRPKGDSTKYETRIADADRNLDCSQDVLNELAPKPIETSQKTKIDLQKSDSSSFCSDDELLQSEEELNGSETALSDSETGLFESRRDSFALRGVHRCVMGKDAVYRKSESEANIHEFRLGVNSVLEDAVVTRSTVSVEESPCEAASDVGEHIDYDILSMKRAHLSGFNQEPIFNGVETSSAECDNGVKSVQGERDCEVYNTLDQSSLLSKEHCHHCTGSNEVRGNGSQKFVTQSVKYRRPQHEQYLTRPLFGYNKQQLNFGPGHGMLGNKRYWNYYDAWYEIFRKQLAWMKYHSWQYRKSTYYGNAICYEYWL